MHPHLSQKQTRSLLDEAQTMKKLLFNQKRNAEQDHSAMMDEAAAAFVYADCANDYWNPESFSLLYGTPLWRQASPSQRIILNQLYWVAYYAQIVSAEIATIFLNQVSAAGLYTYEDFRIVCDSLDLETRQERAHINAFKTIGEETEYQLFGARLFTYPMRSLYDQTMVFADSNKAKDFWRSLQIKAFTLLASSRAFIASQYLLVRGLRTLNGKMIQHELSRHYSDSKDKNGAPIPSRISYYHFMDESFHFNTSKLIGHEIPRALPAPTGFDTWVMNLGVAGCQKDHFHVSATVRGIFWYEPALFPTLYKLFRSRHFGMDDAAARDMLRQCFCAENDGIAAAFDTHRTARASYRHYVDDVAYLSAANRDMAIMGRSTVAGYLKRNARALDGLRAAA